MKLSPGVKIVMGLAAVTLGAGAYYFLSPNWKDKRLDEKLTVNQAQILGQGSLAPKARQVSGRVILIAHDGKVTLRFENFKTPNGTNVRIYLSEDETDKNIIDLGKLKATQGNINYSVEPGTDLKKFKYVLVWNKTFSTLFGSAQLSL